MVARKSWLGNWEIDIVDSANNPLPKRGKLKIVSDPNIDEPEYEDDDVNGITVVRLPVGDDTGVIKPPVRLATAGPLPTYNRVANVITITGDITGGLIVDGVETDTNDRILLSHGVAKQDNGIYKKVGSNVLERDTDADTSEEFTPGMRVPVLEGDDNHDTTWVLATDSAIVLNATPLEFIAEQGAEASRTESVFRREDAVRTFERDAAGDSDFVISTGSANATLGTSVDAYDHVTTSVIATGAATWFRQYTDGLQGLADGAYTLAVEVDVRALECTVQLDGSVKSKSWDLEVGRHIMSLTLDYASASADHKLAVRLSNMATGAQVHIGPLRLYKGHAQVLKDRADVVGNGPPTGTGTNRWLVGDEVRNGASNIPQIGWRCTASSLRTAAKTFDAGTWRGYGSLASTDFVAGGVAALREREGVDEGEVAVLSSYHGNSSTAGGGNLRWVEAADVDNGVTRIVKGAGIGAVGSYWQRILNGEIWDEMGGTKGDGVEDDTPALRRVIAAAVEERTDVRIRRKQFRLTDTLKISIDDGQTNFWFAGSNTSRDVVGAEGTIFIWDAPEPNFTADAGTDLLTSNAHGYVLNDPVRVISTDTLPGGLATATTYYVRDATTNAFKLAATKGGAAIDITSAGSGTHTIRRHVPMITVESRGITIEGIAFRVANGKTCAAAIAIDKGAANAGTRCTVRACQVYATMAFVAFTADAGTDVCTAAGHGFTNGQFIRVGTTNTLPGGLSADADYYIRDATADTFKLAPAPGAAAVNITSAGTGTHRASRFAGRFVDGVVIGPTSGVNNLEYNDVEDCVFEGVSDWAINLASDTGQSKCNRFIRCSHIGGKGLVRQYSGSFMAYGCSSRDAGVAVFDVANPAEPIEINSCDVELPKRFLFRSVGGTSDRWDIKISNTRIELDDFCALYGDGFRYWIDYAGIGPLNLENIALGYAGTVDPNVFKVGVGSFGVGGHISSKGCNYLGPEPWINEGGSSVNFTVDAGTDVVTATGHGFLDGDIVRLATTTTLPAPLSAATEYYVRDATTNTFKLAATEGGAAVNITDTGAGTHSVTRSSVAFVIESEGDGYRVFTGSGPYSPAGWARLPDGHYGLKAGDPTLNGVTKPATRFYTQIGTGSELAAFYKLKRNGVLIVDVIFVMRKADSSAFMVAARRACFSRAAGVTTQLGTTKTLGADEPSTGLPAGFAATIDNVGDTIRALSTTGEAGSKIQVNFSVAFGALAA